MTLQDCRERLDAIDRELTALYCARMNIVREVAAIKAECGAPTLDPAREQALVERVQALAPAEYRESIAQLYAAILSESRAWQNKLREDRLESHRLQEGRLESHRLQEDRLESHRLQEDRL